MSIAASHHHNPMRELERHRWETGHPFLVHASTLPIAVVARGIARTVREQDGVTSSEVNGFNGKTRIGKRDVGVLFADDTVSRDDLVKGAGAKTDQFVVCGVHVGQCCGDQENNASIMKPLVKLKLHFKRRLKTAFSLGLAPFKLKLPVMIKYLFA